MPILSEVEVHVAGVGGNLSDRKARHVRMLYGVYGGKIGLEKVGEVWGRLGEDLIERVEFSTHVHLMSISEADGLEYRKPLKISGGVQRFWLLVKAVEPGIMEEHARN